MSAASLSRSAAARRATAHVADLPPRGAPRRTWLIESGAVNYRIAGGVVILFLAGMWVARRLLSK